MGRFSLDSRGLPAAQPTSPTSKAAVCSCDKPRGQSHLWGWSFVKTAPGCTDKTRRLQEGPISTTTRCWCFYLHRTINAPVVLRRVKQKTIKLEQGFPKQRADSPKRGLISQNRVCVYLGNIRSWEKLDGQSNLIWRLGKRKQGWGEANQTEEKGLSMVVWEVQRRS